MRAAPLPPCYTTIRDTTHREQAGAQFPALTIPFPDGPKAFVGHFVVYNWSRGATGSLVAASALLALEAWGHQQIESGRPFREVLHDVLGPSWSSVAFVCVAVDLVLSHWQQAIDSAWPLVATPEVLLFDDIRFRHDLAGADRFLGAESEPMHWRVKISDLVEQPSRRHRLTDLIGRYTLDGPTEIHTILREELGRARERLAVDSGGGTEDHISESADLAKMADDAYRMTDPAHWAAQRFLLPDGREVEGRQYQLPPDEQASRSQAQVQAAANLGDNNIRLRIQKALMEPETSTPEIVAESIAWAKSQDFQAAQALGAHEHDDFDAAWRTRAVMMAAAVALRDAGGDRAEIEVWGRSILDRAAAVSVEEHSWSMVAQIPSSPAAIAAMGYIGLYQRTQDPTICAAIVGLATRQNHAVLHAIGIGLLALERVEEKLPRALARIIQKCAVRPRRDHDQAREAKNRERFREGLDAVINAEQAWLDEGHSEPPWPTLASWHSRRRRSIRLRRKTPGLADEPERAIHPDTYVDEHALGILANYLVAFTLGQPREWVVSLSRHLMKWTIEANNGPEGDDEHARDNRPYRWNTSYFHLLGVLCVALPFDRGSVLFMRPLTTLHEEAFYDAAAGFLRGFDRATLAPDAAQPDNPIAVRSFFAARLREGRMMERLNWRLSFTAETHLGDALNGMFYQPALFANTGQPYIPKRWRGLLENSSILTDLVTSAPNSGYLAVLFLNLVESFPCAVLVPSVVQAASAWCEVHDVNPIFWNEHHLGQRICKWFELALESDPGTASALSSVNDELSHSLDTLVRAGVPSALLLEARITKEKNA